MTTKQDLIRAKEMDQLILEARIMAQPAKEPVKKEMVQSGIRQPSRQNRTFRAAPKNYDVLNAEEMIRIFGLFLRSVISRVEENQRVLEEAEARETDLSHCMELVEDLTEKERRMLYRRLTQTLQTRRACKVENEILIPLYNYIRDKVLVNKLGQIQGQIAGVKEVVGNRVYGCRTTVLDDFRAECPEKVSAAG